jgi:hypothetical protein
MRYHSGRYEALARAARQDWLTVRTGRCPPEQPGVLTPGGTSDPSLDTSEDMHLATHHSVEPATFSRQKSLTCKFLFAWGWWRDSHQHPYWRAMVTTVAIVVSVLVLDRRAGGVPSPGPKPGRLRLVAAVL